MNYKSYKFLKILEKVFDGVIEIVFYIPRWLYKNSEGFNKFIKSSESKSYNRSTKKRLAKKVFRCLEDSQECILLKGMDDEYGYFDNYDFWFNLLLEDERWIKKNRLKVKKTTYYEYVKENDPERLYLVGNYEKEKEVYIVSR